MASQNIVFTESPDAIRKLLHINDVVEISRTVADATPSLLEKFPVETKIPRVSLFIKGTLKFSVKV